MTKHLSLMQKSEIWVLSGQGQTTRQIAQKTGISQSTVARTIKKYATTGSMKHAGGNGRPSKLSPRLKMSLKTFNKKNNRLSCRKMALQVKTELGIHVSHASVKNYLNAINIFAFSPIKKPLLSKKHIQKRYEASRRWIKMSEDTVKSIIFSDESKFNLFYSDGSIPVWRQPKTGHKTENICPTVKFGGGSVMVWGCFSYFGKGRLHFIDGIMDSAAYCNILSTHLFASANAMGLESFLFMQDNDPKHKSKLTSEFLAENEVELLDWPAQSPDMNPIENLWYIIKRKVAEKKPKNKNQLKEEIKIAWEAIPDELCRKLALSFKKRSLELFRAKGMHISK